MSNFTTLITKWPILTISISYWLVSSVIYYQLGVKIVDDSSRYLEYAQHLKTGLYIDPHNIWYITYVGFIFLASTFGIGLKGIIFLQYVISYVAAIFLFKTSLLVFKRVSSALLAALLQIFFLEIPSWNSYLLPESIYISLVCLSFYFLAKVFQNPTRLNLIYLTLTVVITSFSKPTAFALPAVVLAIFLIHISENRIFKVSVLVVMAVMGLFLLNRMLKTYPLLENYARGETIFEIALTSEASQGLIINTSDKILLPDNALPPLMQVAEFVIDQPVYWLKLFLSKIFLLFIHLKPYWSWQHNLFALMLLVPLYFFSTKGLMDTALDWRLRSVVVIYLLIQALAVGLTWEDWDGRFLLPMLPFLFVLGSFQAVKSVSRLVAKTTELSSP